MQMACKILSLSNSMLPAAFLYLKPIPKCVWYYLLFISVCCPIPWKCGANVLVLNGPTRLLVTTISRDFQNKNIGNTMSIFFSADPVIGFCPKLNLCVYFQWNIKIPLAEARHINLSPHSNKSSGTMVFPNRVPAYRQMSRNYAFCLALIAVQCIYLVLQLGKAQHRSDNRK